MAGEGEEMAIPEVVATGIARTEIEAKWQSLAPILERPGPYARNAEGFYPSAQNLQQIKDARVLVVGAGGLGCEILKDLALSGFTEIHVIDLDTIDLSNLNRQFLFRLKDVGKAKAEVAADFVMKRVKGVNIKHYNRRIETFDTTWYAQFDYVIAGLDNVQARQWLNATLVDLVQFTPTGEVDWKTVVPLIDGGTEAFSGQGRVFVPHFTSCFECSIDSMPPAKGYAVCTIKNIPRLPEHCVIYALQVLWPRLLEFTSATEYKVHEKKDDSEKDPEAIKLDNDDVQHINWLMLRAIERGEQFGIKGVTYSLTQQVVKNIIPAIASTNALISAACVNEVVKLRTFAGDRLDNFYMYIGAGQTGINGSSHQYQRKARCTVCRPRLMFTMPPATLLGDLLKKLKEDMKDEETGLTPTDIQLSFPNAKVEGGKEIIYNKIMSYTHDNLAKPIFSLFKSKTIIWAEGDGLTQKVQITFA